MLNTELLSFYATRVRGQRYYGPNKNRDTTDSTKTFVFEHSKTLTPERW